MQHSVGKWFRELVFGNSQKQSIHSPEVVNIDYVINDREAFNALIYTPLDKALEELKRRWNDPSIDGLVAVPEPLKKGFRGVIFRQLITPNYEIRRFISILDSLDLKPLFWEFYEDKFTSNNEWKHSLGRLFFYNGKGKKNGARIDSLNIIDFNSFNGKKIKEVRTLSNEALIDFHHSLFEQQYPKINLPDVVFDASEWFANHGGGAESYYASFLSLFIKHGILFENFMLDQKELSFTRDIFLPAFLAVWKEIGHKPIIISLEPTEIEGDRFWMCHPHEDRAHIEERISHANMAK